MIPQDIKTTVEVQNLINALDYAIGIIENYEADCRNLKNHINIVGFCQGSIYKNAISDILKIKNGVSV